MSQGLVDWRLGICISHGLRSTEPNRSNWQLTFCPSVPVSQPVLTLSTGKTRALEGDLMTLHCKSLRGSPHIQYEFYYEDVFLDINSMISGGGASFNFSMTTERSGNYYCTADNGLGAQRSEAVRISVIGKTWVPADTQCYTDLPLTRPFGSLPTHLCFLNHPSPAVGSFLCQLTVRGSHLAQARPDSCLAP